MTYNAQFQQWSDTTKGLMQLLIKKSGTCILTQYEFTLTELIVITYLLNLDVLIFPPTLFPLFLLYNILIWNLLYLIIKVVIKGF